MNNSYNENLKIFEPECEFQGKLNLLITYVALFLIILIFLSFATVSDRFWSPLVDFNRSWPFLSGHDRSWQLGFIKKIDFEVVKIFYKISNKKIQKFGKNFFNLFIINFWFLRILYRPIFDADQKVLVSFKKKFTQIKKKLLL